MRPALIAILCSLVFFLAGLWLGQRALPPAWEVRLPEPPPGIDPELCRSLNALTAEVQVLRRELEARPAPSETRAAVVPAAEEPAQRTRPAHAQLQPASLRDPRTAPGFATREDLFQDMETVGWRPSDAAGAEAQALWDEDWGKAVQRWERGHDRWTPDEVIERYGAPDSTVEEAGGPSLVFRRTCADGRTGSITFQTHAGYVYDVDIAVVVAPVSFK